MSAHSVARASPVCGPERRARDHRHREDVGAGEANKADHFHNEAEKANDRKYTMAAHGLPVMDTKVIKGPGMWNGTKSKWKHWSTKLEGYIAGVSQPLLSVVAIRFRRIRWHLRWWSA